MGVYTGVRGSALLEGTDFAFDEAVDASACTGSILELAVDCERNDMRMFESVIEMDFLEAAELPATTGTATTDSATTEKTKKSMWQKIKELVKKAIRKVKEFVANFIAKIKNLFANDQKLYSKYIKFWKSENLKGFMVTDYVPLSQIPEPKDAVEFYGLADMAVSIISKYETKEDVAAFDPKQELKAVKNTLTDNTSYREAVDKMIFGKKIDGEKQLIDIPNQIENIASYVKDARATINRIKNMEKMITDEYARTAKEIKYSKNDKMSDLEIAKINAQYKAVTYITSQGAKVCSAYTGSIGSALARARKVFITGGKYAKNKAEGKEATAESAVFDAMLEICSDAYVESVLYEF